MMASVYVALIIALVAVTAAFGVGIARSIESALDDRERCKAKGGVYQGRVCLKPDAVWK